MWQTLIETPQNFLIPLISGVVGWFTNVVAVKMMFQPIEFIGIRPYLGWQGIIPANARRLAKTALHIVTFRLLDIKEVFRSMDTDRFVEQFSDPFRAVTSKMVQKLAQDHLPAVWNNLAGDVQAQVTEKAHHDIMSVSRLVLKDAQDHIDEILDMRGLLLAAVERDKTLMNRLFLTIGAPEFRFIEHSGFYFGVLFGIVQLLVWVLYPAWWMLPSFGFFVGYATNWVALKMIFDPKLPMRIGPWTIQGLFHRRQAEISVEFARVVTGEVINRDNLFAEFRKPAARAKLLEFVHNRSKELIQSYQKHPMAGMILSTLDVAQVEKGVLAEIEAELYSETGLIAEFADRSGEVRDRILERMAKMEPEAFEDVLRPAFQQDEWKLILAGAILGLAAGFVQLVTLFADIAI